MTGHGEIVDLERGQPVRTDSYRLGLLRLSIGSQSRSSVSPADIHRLPHSPRRFLIPILIAVVGTVASAAFLYLGIRAANKDAQFAFQQKSDEIVGLLSQTWSEYEVAALWIHESARGGNISRVEFRELYETLTYHGLHFKAAQYVPRVTRSQRVALEAESAAFYHEYYPYIDYQGIMGFETDPATGQRIIAPRPEEDVYYPVHLIEPIAGNERVIDLDNYSDQSRRQTVDLALATFKPVLSDRIHLVQETDPSAFSVILMHPGIPLSTQPNLVPEDLSVVVIRIPSLLQRAVERIQSPISVYLYEHPVSNVNGRVYLGALSIDRVGENWNMTMLPEVNVTSINGGRMNSHDIPIADRLWTVQIVAHQGSFEPQLAFVFIGGALILLACGWLAWWVYTDSSRAAKLSYMKDVEAEAEKNALLAQSAVEKVKAERELNDFVAHEVRNPLSAAISACSFVRAAVSGDEPLRDEESRLSVREDLNIIEKSLQFINDLLRNMLDSSRTSNNQLSFEIHPTDLFRDVLDPVESMLYLRDRKVALIVECAPNLVVMTDKLRIKQIVLNLARNSSKFVESGFIRLKAFCTEQGHVRITVEDSGPGIPVEKRGQLFLKFQASLDSLNQGTGIGLSLSKSLSDLLGMNLWLDEEYDSGVPGCPGACFVLDLNKPPIPSNDVDVEQHLPLLNGRAATRIETASVATSDHPDDLPEKLTVLFVDDDMILRKLFARSIKRVAPDWNVEEASNGETALKLVESKSFDLLFIDQYMASVEQQLLGTETTRALRAKGCQSRICGLSANNIEALFLAAGADAFLTKPFPSEPAALKRELVRILGNKCQT